VTHDAYASLRIPAYRRLILSLVTLVLGVQVQALVVGWQLYALTRDPLALGLIGLAEAVPYIGLALAAGHVADRRDRKRIGMLALVLLALCSAAYLTLTVTPGAVGPSRTWPMYVVVAAGGVGRSFLGPVRSALAAELVPRELYPNASAWRSGSWQMATVVGPALGGLLYAWGGPATGYAVAGGLVLVALATFATIRTAPRARAVHHEPMLESLTVGVRFVFGQPVLLAALSLDMFSVLFGGAVALLPVFAAEILHVGPQGLGLLRAAPAVGAVLMSFLLAHRPPVRRAGRTLLTVVAIFGLCMIAFALSRHFLLSLGALMAAGMADTVSEVIRATLVQSLTPDALLGRVSAVNGIFIGSSNEIGAFESGVAAKLLGTVPSVVVGGALTLLVVAITAWRSPALRRLDRLVQ
jgi:MFS family permease